MFVFAVQPLVSATEPSKSAVYTVTANYEVTNEGPGTVSKVDVYIRLYKDMLSQSVLSEEMTVDGQSQVMNVETDAENNRTVHVTLYNFPPRSSKVITLTQKVRAGYFSPQFDPNTVGNTTPLNSSNIPNPEICGRVMRPRSKVKQPSS